MVGAFLAKKRDRQPWRLSIPQQFLVNLAVLLLCIVAAVPITQSSVSMVGPVAVLIGLLALFGWLFTVRMRRHFPVIETDVERARLEGHRLARWRLVVIWLLNGGMLAVAAIWIYLPNQTPDLWFANLNLVFLALQMLLLWPWVRVALRLRAENNPE